MSLKRRCNLDKNRACNKFIGELINAKKSKAPESTTKMNDWLAMLLVHCLHSLVYFLKWQCLFLTLWWSMFPYSQGIHSNLCQECELLGYYTLLFLLLPKALITEN